MSDYPGLTDFVSDIFNLFLMEGVSQNENLASSRKPMLSPEQKSISLFKDIE